MLRLYFDHLPLCHFSSESLYHASIEKSSEKLSDLRAGPGQARTPGPMHLGLGHNRSAELCARIGPVCNELI